MSDLTAALIGLALGLFGIIMYAGGYHDGQGEF